MRHPVISHRRVGSIPTCQNKKVVSKFLESLWQRQGAITSSEQYITCQEQVANEHILPVVFPFLNHPEQTKQ